MLKDALQELRETPVDDLRALHRVAECVGRNIHEVQSLTAHEVGEGAIVLCKVLAHVELAALLDRSCPEGGAGQEVRI